MNQCEFSENKTWLVGVLVPILNDFTIIDTNGENPTYLRKHDWKFLNTVFG